MNILALETGTEELSISLKRNDFLVTKFGNESMQHLKDLIPLIKSTFEEENFELKDLDYIAIDEGPGSFTGLRIGITTARTLSQVLDIPIIPVDALKSFIYIPQGQFSSNQKTSLNKIFVPVLDARANQIYAGAFSLNKKEKSDEIKTYFETNIYEKKDFLAMIDKLKNQTNSTSNELIFLGDSKKIFPESAIINHSYQVYQNSECVLKLAENMLKANFEKIDYKMILPKYYRLSEAERKLGPEK